MEPNPAQKLDRSLKEEIVQPAILLSDGSVVTGSVHRDILAEIFEKDQKLLRGRKEGFVTSSGKFVSREEAVKIALKAGQIKKEVSSLQSQDLLSG